MEGANGTVGGDGVLRSARTGGEGGVGGGFATDGDVGRGGLLVKAGGEDAIVLQILSRGDETGGNAALAVAEDGLEDFDLIWLGDARVVRRKARGIGVVGVAGDGAVGLELA